MDLSNANDLSLKEGDALVVVDVQNDFCQGGPWPAHCVENSIGAEFHPDLHVRDSTQIISKGKEVDKDAYSGFEGTDLNYRLQSAGIHRLLIGGLATDYCVLNTTRDAIGYGYKVLLFLDAIRAVNVIPKDGEKAIKEMIRLGAEPIKFYRLS